MLLDEFLKDWRKHHNITQAVAAKELDITLPTYRGLEQGRPTPYEHVIKMAVRCWEKEGGTLRMLVENSKKVADNG